jgi:hypothetical protein
LEQEITYYRRTGQVIPSARRHRHPYRPEPPESNLAASDDAPRSA